VEEVTLSDLQLRELAFPKSTLQTNTHRFSEDTKFSQLIGYIQTGQMRHNCLNTNVVGWHLQILFQRVQNIQLGAWRFRTSEFED
jgi:hypothetical protein